MSEHMELSGREAAGDVPTPRLSRLASILSRIEETVDEETASIRSDMRFDLRASNARKSRYLYEFNKAVKGADAAQLASEQREAITRLREKLALNEAAIRAHLNAVAEVAALIQQAIQNAETDGTYSAVAEVARG